MKKGRRFKWILWICALLLAAVALLETVMIVDTHEFMVYAHQVFNHEVDTDQLVEQKNNLWVYATKEPGRYWDLEEFKYEYTLFRIFTWHNFHQGAIMVYYDMRHREKDSRAITWRCREIRVWYIEKTDGEWEVVGMNPIKP